MVGIKYETLDDLNNQAYAWCDKVNSKVHSTTNKIPFEELDKEIAMEDSQLSLLTKSFYVHSACWGPLHSTMLHHRPASQIHPALA